jgi:hypothetical protein
MAKPRLYSELVTVNLNTIHIKDKRKLERGIQNGDWDTVEDSVSSVDQGSG